MWSVRSSEGITEAANSFEANHVFVEMMFWISGCECWWIKNLAVVGSDKLSTNGFSNAWKRTN
jgi:hypothetical protein